MHRLQIFKLSLIDHARNFVDKKLPILSSQSSQQNHEAFMIGALAAPDLTNAALQASMRGDHETALKLNLQAVKSKVKAFGIGSVQAALSYKALGENYLALKMWKEAELALQKASIVMDIMARGPAFDAAVCRNNLAQVYEAGGRWEEARYMRLRGECGDQIACGWSKCSSVGGFSQAQFSTCESCESVFYCSRNCQAQDWKARHSVHCLEKASTSTQT